jgi:hypothetical protein
MLLLLGRKIAHEGLLGADSFNQLHITGSCIGEGTQKRSIPIALKHGAREKGLYDST